MPVVDCDYNFIFAYVGCQGRISDGGIYRFTTLCAMLENDSLHLPEPRPLATGRILVPFGSVADDAFVLYENLMKPYPGNLGSLTPERVYNYRLTESAEWLKRFWNFSC